MNTLVLDSPVRPARADARRGIPAGRPQPWLHPPESMAGTPYYDDELDMAQSTAHMHTILFLGALLNLVAKAADLRMVSDNAGWYWLPEAGEQRALYPDYALTANASVAWLTAPELVLALEVVSTASSAKAEKDTVTMRDRNAAHGVREFVLIYPEPDDARAVAWHRDEERTGRYQVVPPSANGRYRSVAVPGLEIEVLPEAEWTLGRKVRVWFQGQELRDSETEARLREAAEQHAAQERAAKEQEQARADRERAAKEQERVAKEQAAQRAARLAERLRALGIDPDTV